MRDQDSVAVLGAIDAMRETFRQAGPLANAIEDAKAAGFVDALDWMQTTIQSQQDGAQGGEAVSVGEVAGLVNGHTGCTDSLAIEAAVAIVDLIASRPAIAPQAGEIERPFTAGEVRDF